MIAQFIINKRIELRLTKTAMSKMMGISRRQYYRIEQGKCDIAVTQLEALCEKLGLKILIIDKALVV
jgi:transcriptional regulator with XRE-family HTH domain